MPPPWQGLTRRVESLFWHFGDGKTEHRFCSILTKRTCSRFCFTRRTAKKLFCLFEASWKKQAFTKYQCVSFWSKVANGIAYVDADWGFLFLFFHFLTRLKNQHTECKTYPCPLHFTQIWSRHKATQDWSKCGCRFKTSNIRQMMETHNQKQAAVSEAETFKSEKRLFAKTPLFV